VDDCGAVWALAFVLAAIVPLVVVALGNLGKRLRFGLRIFGVLAGLAGKTVRVTPWRFGELRAVSAAQPANVVLIANDVAPAFTGAVALGAARHPIPGIVDPLGVQPNLGRIQPHFGQSVAVRLAVQRMIPDVGVARLQAFSPLAGDFRNQDLRVLVHGVSPVRRRPP